MPSPKIIAHRGASSLAPENTLASVRKAIELGVDMVEIDVHLSKDGELMVIHDDSLDRTTDGEGYVKDYTKAVIRKLDAGNWFDAEFKGEKVPVLQEMFDLIAGKCGLLLEIKVTRHSMPGIAEKVVDAIKESETIGWTVVQSFDDEVLFAVNDLNPGIVTHKLIVEIPPIFPGVIDTSGLNLGRLKKYAKQSAINCNHRFMGKRQITKLHNHGFATFAWTVNDKAKGEKLAMWGVDGLITNYPQLFLRAGD